MNYQRIYDLLVEKARNRIEMEGYKEIHHIIPRSLGGVEDSSNLVTLTAREHFIAHLLLAKIYGGSMWHAAHMMSNMKRYTNRKYEKVREEHAKQVSLKHSGKVVSEETRRKISESHKGHSWNKGIPKTEEHKRKYREARIASGGWVVSKEQKQKVSEKLSGQGNPMWGKTHNEEARRIISEANKQKVTCPHCGKTGGIAIMKRWHFSNCKS